MDSNLSLRVVKVNQSGANSFAKKDKPQYISISLKHTYVTLIDTMMRMVSE